MIAALSARSSFLRAVNTVVAIRNPKARIKKVLPPVIKISEVRSKAIGTAVVTVMPKNKNIPEVKMTKIDPMLMCRSEGSQLCPKIVSLNTV